MTPILNPSVRPLIGGKLQPVCALFILLISSLPLLPFRMIFGILSLTHFFFGLCSLFGLVFVLNKKEMVFSGLDAALVCYLLWSMTSFIFFSSYNQDSIVVLLKSTAYFSAYFFTKQLFLSLKSEHLFFVFRWGIFLGCLWILVILVFGALSVDLTNISYHKTTVGAYGSIGESLFGISNIESSDVMRNVQGEVFALYMAMVTVLSLNDYFRFRFFPIFLFLAVLFTFSRRALVASISIVTFFFIKSKGLTRIFVLVFGVLIVSFLLLKFSDSLRTFSLDETRIAQNRLAFFNLNDSPSNLFFGLGLGSKVLGAYVHNFLISSFYMLGLPGLILSIMVFGNILFRWARSFFDDRIWGVFLIIPLLGMAVGSTAEGVFTIPGWLALIFSVTRLKSVDR